MSQKQKTWRGVIKLQRAIAGHDSVLIYNQARSILLQWSPEDLPPVQWKNLLSWFDGEPKVYVNARVDADGTLHILSPANDQPW